MKKGFLSSPICPFLFILAFSTSCNGQGAAPITDDNENKRHSSIAVGDTVSETGKSIWIVFQDKANNYWFGSDGQGVYRYDGKTTLHFSTKDGLCNDRVREIQEDKSGNIYFATLDGISKFDGQVFTTLTPVINPLSANEWKLEPDDLWFKENSMRNGPYRYDGKSLFHLNFPKHYLEDEYYASNPNAAYSPYGVYTIYKDRSGNIWFGTSCLGIGRYDGKSFSWMFEKHLTDTPEGGSFGIRSILEDKEGKFWFCNTRYRYNIHPKDSIAHGTSLINYSREKGIDHLQTPNGDDLIYYLSIVEDNYRDLWMATWDAGVWRYDGKTATHYPVKDGPKDIKVVSIFKDNRGDLWLGTQEAGVYKFNGETFEKW